MNSRRCRYCGIGILPRPTSPGFGLTLATIARWNVLSNGKSKIGTLRSGNGGHKTAHESAQVFGVEGSLCGPALREGGFELVVSRRKTRLRLGDPKKSVERQLDAEDKAGPLGDRGAKRSFPFTRARTPTSRCVERWDSLSADGSNPSPSSGESTNFRFLSRRRPLFDRMISLPSRGPWDKKGSDRQSAALAALHHNGSRGVIARFFRLIIGGRSLLSGQAIASNRRTDARGPRRHGSASERIPAPARA
jgi:hypothetical protein